MSVVAPEQSGIVPVRLDYPSGEISNGIAGVFVSTPHAPLPVALSTGQASHQLSADSDHDHFPECYKCLTDQRSQHQRSMMQKPTEQWLLFKYIDGQFTPLSKPFKTREEAEDQRQKYPERERKGIGLGVIRS